MLKKRCSKCSQNKELNGFNPTYNRPSKYRSECKQCQYARQYKREKANRHKIRAKDKARHAVKMGLLKAPAFCQSCKEKKPLDKHHPDYSQQYLIRWLCRKCHTRLHSLLGSYRRAI